MKYTVIMEKYIAEVSKVKFNKTYTGCLAVGLVLLASVAWKSVLFFFHSAIFFFINIFVCGLVNERTHVFGTKRVRFNRGQTKMERKKKKIVSNSNHKLLRTQLIQNILVINHLINMIGDIFLNGRNWYVFMVYAIVICLVF